MISIYGGTSGSGRPIVLQFRQRVGVHIAGRSSAPSSSCPEGLYEGEGAVDVEASGTEGETTLVVEVPGSVPVAADVVSCAGVEVEETNGGAC